MISTFLTLLAVSLDVFSFGVSLGAQKRTISPASAVYFTMLSCCIFGLPFLLSARVYAIVSRVVCVLINGGVLLGLGAVYLFGYIFKSLSKSLKFGQNSPLVPYFQNLQVFPHKSSKTATAPLKTLSACAIPVNLDAFFTALLSGYGLGAPFLVLSLNFTITLSALILGNRISLFFSQKKAPDMGGLSGVIFICLGILKLLEI